MEIFSIDYSLYGHNSIEMSSCQVIGKYFYQIKVSNHVDFVKKTLTIHASNAPQKCHHSLQSITIKPLLLGKELDEICLIS